jgi:hypothetical protein
MYLALFAFAPVCLAAFGFLFALASAINDPEGNTGIPLNSATSILLLLVLLALPLGGLWALVRHLDRRASTPLPPPAADPLATYRAAPAECPRHPFARREDVSPLIRR